MNFVSRKNQSQIRQQAAFSVNEFYLDKNENIFRATESENELSGC